MIKFNSLIFVEDFLTQSQAAQILMDQFSRMHARKKPLSRIEKTLAASLREGSNALEKVARESLSLLMERGQLLYAWEGTTVVSDQEGGAE